jgi:hypothetical protein
MLARRVGSWGSKKSRRGTLKPLAAQAQAAAAQAAGPQATFDPTTQVGVTEPVGFWDPVSLMQERYGEWKSEETFTQWREAEIKHGRLAMMASLGLVAGAFNKFPGFEDVPSGFAALQTSTGGAGFGIVVLLAAFFEVDFWKQDPSKAPGNFGDPLGVGAGYPESGYSTEMRNKELNHGRLAMSGVGTELLIEYLTKMTPEQQVEQLVPGAVFALFFGLVLVWSNYPEEGSSDSSALATRSDPPGMPAPTKTWLLFAVLAVFLERTIHAHA